MNKLRQRNSNWLSPAMWLAIVVAISAGCRDAASHTESPPSGSLNVEVQQPSDPGDATKNSKQGQPSRATDPEPRAAGVGAVTTPENAAPKVPIALPAVKPDAIYEPSVVLSRAHGRTCLVNVGDALPDLALKSLAGEPVSLNELRGDMLTVVVFWTNRFASSREQIQRLAAEVALPFRHLGVKVVAVNVGDPVEQIELDATTRDAVTCVLDPDGTATAQVATAKLPRTYVIDREGRILWFDIEYSRTTRRQLTNAIFYFTREESAASS